MMVLLTEYRQLIAAGNVVKIPDGAKYMVQPVGSTVYRLIDEAGNYIDYNGQFTSRFIRSRRLGVRIQVLTGVVKLIVTQPTTEGTVDLSGGFDYEFDFEF